MEKYDSIQCYKSFNFYTNLLGIKIKVFDTNPIKQKDANDCSIVAICKLTNLDWDTVYNSLCDIGKKNKVMPNSVFNISEFLHQYGYDCITRFGGPDSFKMTIGEFMYKNTSGSFLIGNAKHCCAYIDGTWYDNDKNLKNPDKYIISKIQFAIYKKSEPFHVID